jgi:aminomethyltransferase
MKKSSFFDFLNRHDANDKFVDLKGYLAHGELEQDYIDWNGYLLPQSYGNAEQEYHAIRHECAMFDVSPIRKCWVRGAKAGYLLDHLFTRPISSAPSMRGIYTVFCQADGNLKDDAVVYKYTDDEYLLMPSDIDHRAHLFTLCEQLGLESDSVTIEDCTEKFAGAALQGPLSSTVLHKLGFAEVEQLQPFEVKEYPFADGVIRIARMGFTADLGYECWFEVQYADHFQQLIIAARDQLGIAIPGYGLAALEVCRLEGGFIVAGWDFATEVDYQEGFQRSPYEVGLGWLVNMDEVEFFGKPALLEKKSQGHGYLLRTFSASDRRLPADGATIYAIFNGERTAVGSVNCSAWSWGMQAGIGNASIERQYIIGDIQLEQVAYMIGEEMVAITLGKGPHLDLVRRNQVPAPIN